MNHNPVTIVFDFGGVLMQHDRKGCLQALQGLMPDDAIFDVLGFGNDRPDTLRHRFELGLISMQEFLNHVLALCRQGTTAQQIIDAWNTMHAGIPDSIWSQVERLHSQGYRLYLMSNTDEIHWQHTLSLYRDRIERLFGKVFLSFEEGLAKPDVAFFQVVNKRMDAEQIWFVDDMEVNRQAAERYVGWKTCATIDSVQRQLLQL